MTLEVRKFIETSTGRRYYGTLLSDDGEWLILLDKFGKEIKIKRDIIVLEQDE